MHSNKNTVYVEPNDFRYLQRLEKSQGFQYVTGFDIFGHLVFFRLFFDDAHTLFFGVRHG